jgi:hypothetical protein
MNRRDYPEVIELVCNLAREHRGIDFDDLPRDNQVGRKDELLDLLRRLRQEVFLHSRSAVSLVTERYSRVLDVSVPGYINIVQEQDSGIAPSIPDGAFMEGTAAADAAVVDLDILIHALGNDTGDTEDITV